MLKNLKNFENILIKWFRKNGRKRLPWRKKGITPYEVWVSEVMLQQTQVSRVIKYYTRFLKKFPNIRSLARTEWEEFLPYYAGLGYYRRGRNMLETARIIVKKYHGKFPQDKNLLKALPGIGEYTANAILSFGFGEQKLAYDTNARRLFGRIFYGSKNASVDREKIEKGIHGNFRSVNAAVMDFASSVCVNRPKCGICPFVNMCHYYKEGGKREKRATKARQSVFSAKNAHVHLWLHKDHKEYYSSNPDFFEVFMLKPPYNTREKIKEYFKEHFGLELSVRPPHKKILLNNIPTLFVNAQILLGEHEFGVFRKNDAHP